MKILMVTMGMDIGGAETHILELSRELKSRGLDITVASNGGAYEKELLSCGISHIKVPCHSKNPIAMRKSYKILKKLILKEKYDVIHAHARIPGFICDKLQKKLDFRFVTTAHWVFNPSFPYNLLTKWGQRSLAVSDDIKKYLADNYAVPADNIRVTINGIDLKKFSKDTDYSDVKKEFDLNGDSFRIVYVSRMDTDRSFAAHKLIEIMPELDTEFNDKKLECVIVGGGNDFDAVKAEADAVNEKLGRRAVICTGARTDINRFAASGDIFIGVSRSALEAMACEKPAIIAGNEGYIGIFDEDKLQLSIDTNFCCRGCEETTAQVLLRDVRHLISAGESELRRLGSFGRDTIKEHYSMKTMADDAVKLYISVIKDSKINETDAEEDISDYLRYNPLSNGRRKRDVLISGYYGFFNMGDDSILDTLINELRKISPNIKITALAKHPKTASERFGVKCICRTNALAIIREMRRTKVLLSGGGSLFQDSTSSKSLKYYATIVNLAKRCGMKTFIYANGIGSISREKNKKLTAKTVCRTDKVTVRDHNSFEELVSIGVPKEKITISADPAFVINGVSAEKLREIRKKHGMEKVDKFFAISLRRFEGDMRKAYSESNLIEKISAAAAESAKKYGAMPVLVSMQPKLDREISNIVVNKMRDEYKTDAMVIEPENGEELLSILKGCDGISGASLVCAMRLHILIYACSAAVPVIGLSIDPKIDALGKSIKHMGLFRLEDLDSDVFTPKITELIDNRDEIVDELTSQAKVLRKKASDDVLAVFELLK